MGWELDWRKFRQYLKDKYHVEKAFLFIGYLPGNEHLYTYFQRCGYLVIFKPTMELPDGTVKGNVDAELVMHTMIEFGNYDKAIIVSGDGDFHCLIEYLEKQSKLYRVLAPNAHYSSILRKFNRFIVRTDQLKGNLETKRTEINGRTNP